MKKMKLHGMYFYCLQEGSMIDKCDKVPLFWYKDNDGKYILNIFNTGVRISNEFDKLEDLELYIDDNYEVLNNIGSRNKDKYIKLCDRFNNLVSEEEFESMRDVFISNIGYDLFTFYNTALLISTGKNYFDVAKFDEYLQKEYYDEYLDGISLEEFVKGKFGEELHGILKYLLYCNDTMY